MLRLALIAALVSAPACWHGLSHGSDQDGDGLADDRDKCPDVPEDFDGFEDEDGCPEPDNDRDGILDIDDKCPNQPGPRPGGCPVKAGKPLQLADDSDRDGIPNDRDKCPNDPEDRDGFQDEDGCPDPDNDRDGVPDTSDHCMNEPGKPANNGCP